MVALIKCFALIVGIFLLMIVLLCVAIAILSTEYAKIKTKDMQHP